MTTARTRRQTMMSRSALCPRRLGCPIVAMVGMRKRRVKTARIIIIEEVSGIQHSTRLRHHIPRYIPPRSRQRSSIPPSGPKSRMRQTLFNLRGRAMKVEMRPSHRQSSAPTVRNQPFVFKIRLQRWKNNPSICYPRLRKSILTPT